MRTLLTLILVAGLAVFVFMYACGSGNAAGRSQSTAVGMDELRTLNAKAKATLQAVGKSCQAISDAAKIGPEGAFKQFKLDIEALKSARGDLYDGEKALKSSVGDYFSDWEKLNAAISDEQLRKIGDGRRSELQLAYTDVEKSLATLRGVLDPYVVTLEDLERYLTSDLTPAGITAIDQRIRAASKEAARIEGQFGQVEAALTRAAPRFTVPKPAPSK